MCWGKYEERLEKQEQERREDELRRLEAEAEERARLIADAKEKETREPIRV
jgi:hypothetical protein